MGDIRPVEKWMREAAKEIADEFDRALPASGFGLAWENSTAHVIAAHAPSLEAPEDELERARDWARENGYTGAPLRAGLRVGLAHVLAEYAGQRAPADLKAAWEAGRDAAAETFANDEGFALDLHYGDADLKDVVDRIRALTYPGPQEKEK